MASKEISVRDIVRYRPAIATFLLGSLSGNFATYRSLCDIALAIKSRDENANHDKRAVRDKRASRDEETSSDEEMSNDEDSFNDRESFSDEEASNDEDASVAKNPSKRMLHKAVKYAKYATTALRLWTEI